MRKTKRSITSIILSVLFLIYFAVLLKITVFRDGVLNVQSVNLIPFYTIFEYLQSVLNGNKIIGISNLLGNLIIFMPLGFMSALLFPQMRKLKRVLLLSFVLSSIIELVQYGIASGTADIDDVILNITGAVTGFGLYILTSKLFGAKKHAVLISTIMIAVTCFGFYSFSKYKFLLPLPDFSTLQGDTYIKNNASTEDKTQDNISETKWSLILVNKSNPVPADYRVELVKLKNGESVDKRIYPALQEMFVAARDDGIYMVIASGYRSTAEQQQLMDEKIAAFKVEGYSAEQAEIKAREWVSIPGTSEHQIGLAVDINADGIHSKSNEVYDWLDKNACKHGFIRRYPPGKSQITGIKNEPWHYRYVGIEAAVEIQSRGICLEEYLNDPFRGTDNGTTNQGKISDEMDLPPLN